jgi:hypothetical protein
MKPRFILQQEISGSARPVDCKIPALLFKSPVFEDAEVML